MGVQERLEEYGGFVDVGILRHGFASHMRDHDVLFEAMWGKKEWGDDKGTYRLRFTHCPEVSTETSVSDASWRESWSDIFVDYEDWIEAGEPDGFVWGVCWSCAYPGLRYVKSSSLAREWSKRLDKQMHEVVIDTEAFHLRVVFHDYTVTKLNSEVQVVHKVIHPFSNRSDEGAS